VSNFLAAAKATTQPPLPHQQAAWNYAWELLAPDEQANFLGKFRSDPPVKPALAHDAAVKLICEFEGFEANAYPDPASGGDPWTVGYGFTTWTDGAKVKKGDTITRDAADRMLAAWIETKVVPALAKSIPGWNKLPPNRQSCLISFAWNLGWHFYGSAGFETISKCLAEQRYDDVPAALLLYVNPGSAVEVGLRRRREAEGKLWGGGMIDRIELKVPYESQNDNKSGTGYRECFSSSCAMVAKFYGKVASDDAYNVIRARYGDTTDAQAQVQALRALGLEARLVTNAAPGLLETELRAGRPVPVGWLHKGPIAAPSGGGHWSVVTGFNPSHWIVNDPNGEADLVNGGYVSNTNGKGQRYSKANFNRRWMPDGASSGWALLVRPA
jgi:GH24 family phage-related lysozyme (muramidase)